MKDQECSVPPKMMYITSSSTWGKLQPWKEGSGYWDEAPWWDRWPASLKEGWGVTGSTLEPRTANWQNVRCSFLYIVPKGSLYRLKSPIPAKGWHIYWAPTVCQALCRHWRQGQGLRQLMIPCILPPHPTPKLLQGWSATLLATTISKNTKSVTP